MAEVFADDICIGYNGSEPYIVLLANTVYDPNGRIDPGETSDFTSTLWNVGAAGLTNVNTTIVTSSPYITINDNTGYFGDLAIDVIKENTADPYTVTVAASTPEGTRISFDLITTANGGFVDTIGFLLIVGQGVPTDTGYYYSYYSGGPHNNCPVFSWNAIDSAQSANPGVSLDMYDNQTVAVALPFSFQYYGISYDTVSICSNGWIAMGAQTASDWTNSNIPNLDGPEAMIAGMWDDLDPGNPGASSDVYYYYDATTHVFIIEYFQVEHWPSGNPETFEFTLYDPAYYPTPTGDGEIIVQYLNEPNQVDYTAGIENYSQDIGVEYCCDDIYNQWGEPITSNFAIKYTTWPPDQNPGIEEYKTAITPSDNSFGIFPSITKSDVNISYMLGHDSEVSLSIYDASGRLVRSFERSDRTATLVWDCRDAAGHKVSTGVYFIKLESDNYQNAQKVIVLD